MYYQNLNVIHEPSKKLLTMKSVKCFLTPSTCTSIILALILKSKITDQLQVTWTHLLHTIFCNPLITLKSSIFSPLTLVNIVLAQVFNVFLNWNFQVRSTQNSVLSSHWSFESPSKEGEKQERQWRSAHPASRNIKYRKFHVVQFSTGQKINIWCPGKGLKIKKLEWEKYKFDAPEGTWKKRRKKRRKKKKKKLIAPPGPFQGSVNLHKLA